MIITAILAAAAMAAGPPITQPELFGLTIGQPMPYEECPEATQPNGKPRKRDRYWRWIYGGAHIAGAPCFQRRANEGTGQPFDSIESVQVSFPETLKVAGASNLGVMIVAGKVASIGMPTNGELSQESDLAILTGKFGLPSKIDREEVHNGFGVRFIRINAVWDFGNGIRGEFLGFRAKRTEGGFGISTPESRAEIERQMQRLRNFGRDL